MAKKKAKRARKQDIGKKIEKSINKWDNTCSTDKCGCGSMKNSCCNGAVYGLGLIGALIYYISTATGFWNGVLGVVKAILWPAFLVYESLKFLGM